MARGTINHWWISQCWPLFSLVALSYYSFHSAVDVQVALNLAGMVRELARPRQAEALRQLFALFRLLQVRRPTGRDRLPSDSMGER